MDHKQSAPHDEHIVVSTNKDTEILVQPHDDPSSSFPLPRYSFVAAESAGLLALFSLLIFIEGGIRLNAVDAKMLTRSSTAPEFPPVVSFISAIAELLFGLLGLVLGVFSVVSSSFDRRILTLSSFVQIGLSIFVFVVQNLAEPIYRIKHVIPYPEPRPVTDVSLFRGAESMALLTGVQFTLALFLGQLIFMTRLAASSAGREVWSFPLLRSHAIAWNANLGLAGLWTLVLGSGVLSHKELFPSSPKISGTVFFFRPHAGTEPGFTIATGVIMFGWGTIGVLLALKRHEKVNWFMLGSVVVAVVVYLNFTLVQFSLLRMGLRGGGFIATNTAFVFVTFFLSCFFLYRAKVQVNENK